MTTKISATTSGLTETVDTSGVLEFQTGNVSALVIGTDQNANFTGTTAITVPNGTTAQRPTPVNGMMRYNTSLSIFEVYANNTWSAANVTPTPVNTVAPVISGSAVVGQNLTSTTGTWSGSPSAYYYQWRANSTAISNATANVFTLTLAENGANITCNVTAYNVAGNSTPATSNTLGPVINGVTASYLQVAGGGAGGSDNAGGGGGGGLLSGTTLLIPGTTYTVIVGAGGAAPTGVGTNGSAGANSQFGSLTVSVGGGYGAKYASNGGNGGSGGGSGGWYASATTAGSATSGQGYAGGAGDYSSVGGGGGGGGGAGAVGSGASGNNGGNGGNGASSSISGSSVTYAGGGGGGSAITGTGASGGTGGGGTGSSAQTNSATAGTANLGGGGGGGSYGNGANLGRNGGSGVVIISYAGAQQFGGGVISSAGGNTIHTFYTSGSLVPLTALSASYLTVAGGGSGGTNGAGGGGAGGLLSGSNVTIDSNSTYVITVGAGGASVSGTSNGVAGGNSSISFSNVIAIGGGYGGTGGSSGGPGGSGGGGGYTTGNGGAGTAGQGYAGGQGGTGSGGYTTGGGGGGAAQVGFAGTGGAGNGGNGSTSSISGTATYYAGGGGGAGDSRGSGPGTGGLGGGGNASNSGAGSAGTANTGGGGGAGGYSYNVSGAGGSGVVIISYPGSTPMMAGGNVTVVSNTVVHTFTSSGYLTSFVNLNNSLRWRSSNSAYLNRTPTVTSNQKTWTWSAWVKRGVLGSGSNQFLFLAGTGDTARTSVVFIGDLLYSSSNNGGGYNGVNTNAYFRDPSAWYHIVAVWDTTQASSSNRIKLYVNGVLQSVTANGTIAQNEDTYVNLAGTPNTLGVNGTYNLIQYFDGYMTEIRLIDGQALGPNYFGAYDQYGTWKPIAYSGSYGTNGFYLPFSNTANTTALGYDFSGNGNNWTTHNFSLTAGATYDAMVDVPTNTSNTAANYCTWNPLSPGQYSRALTSFSNGNLLAGGTASGMAVGTMQWGTTGKFYFEQTVTTFGTSTAGYGVCNLNTTMNTDNALEWNTLAPYYNVGQIQNGGAIVGSFSGTYAQGDIIGFAVDVDNGTMAIYKNNTLQTTVTTAQLVSSGGIYTNFQNMAPFLRTALNYESTLNCGQRPFAYTPPSGYLPLNSYNI